MDEENESGEGSECRVGDDGERDEAHLQVVCRPNRAPKMQRVGSGPDLKRAGVSEAGIERRVRCGFEDAQCNESVIENPSELCSVERARRGYTAKTGKQDRRQLRRRGGFEGRD
uniref:Uncharacterized protein n=1 Tax=Mycena chlorophos TaxID=658473 RepID=A0ABQ0M7G7_MYCCL|nr:predicted protein [Mycena chlorophos]